MSYTQKIEKGYEEQGIEIDENGELRYRGTGSPFSSISIPCSSYPFSIFCV
jgi:hypothetical protein